MLRATYALAIVVASAALALLDLFSAVRDAPYASSVMMLTSAWLVSFGATTALALLLPIGHLELWRRLPARFAPVAGMLDGLAFGVESRSLCPEVAVSELFPYGATIGYTFERYRLVVDGKHDIERVFDSRQDPFDKNDIFAEQPDLVAEPRKSSTMSRHPKPLW